MKIFGFLTWLSLLMLTLNGMTTMNSQINSLLNMYISVRHARGKLGNSVNYKINSALQVSKDL